MEARHKQTSNRSILQVNHLRWPQRATAQRGERRREQHLEPGGRWKVLRHPSLSSKQKTGKFLPGVEIFKLAPPLGFSP